MIRRLMMYAGLAFVFWSFGQTSQAAAPVKTAPPKKSVKSIYGSGFVGKGLSNKDPKNIQRWDRMMSQAVVGNDKAILFVLNAGSGIPKTERAYGQQLTKVFNSQPIKTIQLSRKQFANNDSCLLWWIVPANPKNDVTDVELKLKSLVNQPIAKGFYESAVQYRRALKDRLGINYSGCKFL